MKIILSPAKTLDFKTQLSTERSTKPRFLERTTKINNELEAKSKKELSSLMGISDKLAELNYQRYKEYHTPFTKSNSRPAIYTFAGDVYSGLDIFSLPLKKLDLLQDSVRILSGMYGILRPLDLMQAYRLEMGTKLTIGKEDDLYKFWKETITDSLNKELKKNELFLNLASVEYFKAVDASRLKTTVVSPIFKDFKNNQLKIISFYAKKARGSMARFAIDHNIDSLDDLKSFDTDGYSYSERYTEDELHPVFIR